MYFKLISWGIFQEKIDALIDIAEYKDDADLKNVVSMGQSSLNW